MAYIETHQSLFTHRKTLRLARLLHLDTFAVVGRLMALWCWGLDNAPDGLIAAQDSDILADVLGWDGAPGDLCNALVTAGFLDICQDGYTIHDWQDYAGKLIEKRRADAERKRAARSNPGPNDNPPPHPQDIQRTAPGHPTDGAGNVPYRTLPKRSVPERENAREVAARAEHNEPLSLSLVASQSPEPETRAEPEMAPADIPDPLAERDRNHALYDAWCAATGYTPKTSGERKSWLKALAGMHRDVGLSPPECAPLVGQYRAKMGSDKQPTPGQVSAMYSQLGVSPHVQLHPVGRSPAQTPALAPEDAARRKRAILASAGIPVPIRPELDNLGS